MCTNTISFKRFRKENYRFFHIFYFFSIFITEKINKKKLHSKYKSINICFCFVLCKKRRKNSHSMTFLLRRYYFCFPFFLQKTLQQKNAFLFFDSFCTREQLLFRCSPCDQLLNVRGFLNNLLCGFGGNLGLYGIIGNLMFF